MVTSGGAEGACLRTVPLHEGLVPPALSDRGPALAHHLLVLALSVLDAAAVAGHRAVDVHEAGVVDALALHGPPPAVLARVHATYGFGERSCDHKQADEKRNCDPCSRHFS